MSGKQETNYFKCGDCKKRPTAPRPYKITIDLFCKLTVTEALAGDWEKRPACRNFEAIR